MPAVMRYAGNQQLGAMSSTTRNASVVSAISRFTREASNHILSITSMMSGKTDDAGNNTRR
jgi:hypothetical protein